MPLMCSVCGHAIGNSQHPWHGVAYCDACCPICQTPRLAETPRGRYQVRLALVIVALLWLAALGYGLEGCLR